jgi:pyruvate formate lyase activating enzyme
MELLGARMSARALAAELIKDRDWWKRSDRGGVTLSGGEAGAQAAFSREVLRLCRAAGAHTALDTSGVAAWELLETLYAEVDLVLFDLKEADPERHKTYTGLDNELVLRNFGKTADLMRGSPRPAGMWIRTPVIPGATAREENMFQLGRIIAEVAPPRLERWELCAFNNLCADKYSRLGREWSFARAPLMEASEMEALAEAARSGSRGRVPVSWTGAVRMEKAPAGERKQL